MFYNLIFAQTNGASFNEYLGTPLLTVILSSLLAFIIATLITLIELVTGKYSQTIGLFFKNSKALYIYGITYGIISFIIAFFIDSLIVAEQIQIQGLGTGNPWIRSLIVGFSVKGFMKISIFNISNSRTSEAYPIGLSSIVQIFEPSLLLRIGLDEFNAIQNFLKPYLKNPEYENVNKVRDLILENLPSIRSPAYRVGLVEDIKEQKNVKDLMEIYLAYFGEEAFIRVFS